MSHYISFLSHFLVYLSSLSSQKSLQKKASKKKNNGKS